ncbi:hypothetical protein L1987_50134 [Smallanthus sonchifolius]|uniref:Uncharacterized protein n=1 Tax=Smallanthus sonchifolius TaxID=185202 RepID=A0ACB9FXJ2_9ASTR|nr:hypothetical protein L1987_50134 [Smallanthus sonchifolius]
MAGTEDHHHIIQETGFISNNKNQSRQFKWVFDEVKNNVTDEYESDFVEECSDDSSVTLSSSEVLDDATSSSSCSSSSSMSFQDGPLYELSELMAQLPLKRGLSKFYHGKSESFGSLANFKNIEDLEKKRSQRPRRSKCKSQKLSPKGTIVKNKKSCSSFISSCLVSSNGEMSSILDKVVLQKRF